MPPTTAPGTSAPVPTTGGSGLAFTGTDVTITAAIGAGAIASGGLLLLGSRRRRADV